MDGVLVVTGASRGIGAATALLGSQRGYRVCVNYVRDARAANGVADAIRRAGGEAIVVQADIGHEAEVARLFATVDRTLGTVTALVNNAGILETQCAASRLGSPGEYLDYAASKGAIDTFTHGLALEVADEGIRVNAVRPGIIETEIHASGGEPGRPARIADSLPMRRPGRPEEVAEAILWLLSDASSYTTGTIVDVAGGR